jgi:hypothetical protein
VHGPGFISRQEQEIYFFSEIFKAAQGPAQPFTPWIKRPGRGDERSPPSGGEVKN